MKELRRHAQEHVETEFVVVCDERLGSSATSDHIEYWCLYLQLMSLSLLVVHCHTSKNPSSSRYRRMKVIMRERVMNLLRVDWLYIRSRYRCL